MKTVFGAVLVAVAVLVVGSSSWATLAKFVKVYGDTIEDNAEDVIRVVENDSVYYVVTGWTHRPVGSLEVADLFVAKFNEDGGLVFRTVVGDTTNAGHKGTVGQSLVQAYSEGYLVAGATKAYGQGNSDFLLLRIKRNGDFSWGKVYGGSGKDDCERIIKIGGNRYLLGGNSPGGGDQSEFLVVEVDTTGSVNTSKVFLIGTDAEDYFCDVIKTADAYVLAGWTKKYEATRGHEAVVMDYDTLWSTQNWCKRFGSASGDEGAVCLAQYDTTVVFVGGTNSVGQGGRQDALIGRLSLTDGHRIWMKVCGTPEWDFLRDVMKESDSDTMVAVGWVGTSPANQQGLLFQRDFALVKFDPSAGTFLRWWATGDTLDEGDQDFGRAVVETGSGYVAVGRTWSWGDSCDVMIVKYNSGGETCQGRWTDPTYTTLNWNPTDLTVSKTGWSNISSGSLTNSVVLNPRAWSSTGICTQ
jgi:hypothetical protein